MEFIRKDEDGVFYREVPEEHYIIIPERWLINSRDFWELDVKYPESPNIMANSYELHLIIFLLIYQGWRENKPNHHKSFPSYELIREKTRMHPRNIAKAIKSLKAKGVLNVKKVVGIGKEGHPYNEYTINLEPLKTKIRGF